jgi:hypothetical protein
MTPDRKDALPAKHSQGPKLSEAQIALLRLALGRQFVSFHHAVQVGASGPTLAAAVRFGWMERIEYPDGSRDWTITDAGRAAITSATQGEA